MLEHDEPLDPAVQELARCYNTPPATPRDVMWERIQAARRAEGRSPAATPVIPFRRPAPAPVRVRRVAWAAGIAALLATGVAIGRLSAPGVANAPIAAGTTDRAAPEPFSAPVTADPAPQELVATNAEPAVSRSAPRPAGRAIPVRLPGADESPRGGRDTSRDLPDDDNAAFRMVAAQHLSQAETFLTLFRASVRSGRTEAIGSRTARQLLASNRLLLDSPASNDMRTRRLLEDLELVLAQITQLPADGQEADARLITDGMEAGDVLPRLRTAVPADLGVTLYQGAL